MEITNYTLKEFAKVPTETAKEYAEILKYMEPIPTAINLQDLTFGEVEDVKQSISDEDYLPTLFKLMEGLDVKEFYDLRISTFYGLLNDILRQLKNLQHMEEQHLQPKNVNMKWETVEGSKRLSTLGVLPIIDRLASGVVLDYERVLSMPYMTAFNVLRMDAINSDIQHDLSKIELK